MTKTLSKPPLGVASEAQMNPVIASKAQMNPVIASKAQMNPVIASKAQMNPVIASEAWQSLIFLFTIAHRRDRFVPRDTQRVL